MATEIYLGYPPDPIRDWMLSDGSITPPIENPPEMDDEEPILNEKTVFYFDDGTSEEHDIIGELDMDRLGMLSNSKESLVKVEIGTNVTSINGAFENCGSLTSVTIPSSVTSIGDYTFFGCRSLASMTIPSSVTSIGGFVFISCSGLTSVTIPSSVTSIGDRAFLSCDSLTIHVPNQQVKDLVVDSGFDDESRIVVSK